MLGVSLKKLPLHFSTVSAQQKVLTIFFHWQNSLFYLVFGSPKALPPLPTCGHCDNGQSSTLEWPSVSGPASVSEFCAYCLSQCVPQLSVPAHRAVHGVYFRTHTHIHTHTRTYTHTHAYTHTHTTQHTHAYTHTHTQHNTTHTHVRTHTHTHRHLIEEE